MAIAPIPSIYHGFTFAGEYSADYGVYIQEPAVFDAPERDVEMITIPGRDGELVLDKGRYRNIEVTYHCTLPASSEGDFITGIANFRNMLASKVGYQRLEDDINTSEYRQAAFNSGLAVNTVNIESGTFDVVFNCKPQRFLTTGETAVELQSGDTITNPTLFESRPMLQVWGYGDIDIDGQEVAINSGDIGLITLAGYTSFPHDSTTSVTMQLDKMDLLNPGDDIYIRKPTSVLRNISFGATITSASCTNPDIFLNWHYYDGTIGVRLNTDTTIPAGTATTVFSESGTLTVNLSDSTTETFTVTFSMDVSATGLVSMTASVSGGTTTRNDLYVVVYGVDAYSTQTAIGAPIYFDLDIGEAYKIENDVPVSVNNAVTIPAVLPTLKPGSNTITFDNTITQFKIVPRWWQL